MRINLSNGIFDYDELHECLDAVLVAVGVGASVCRVCVCVWVCV